MALKSLVPWRRRELARRGDPFAFFQREMNELFDRFFEGGELAPFDPGAFAPEVDVTEKDGEVRISIELPGVDEKDVDLSLTEEALTVRGEKKAEKEEKEGGRHYVERTYGCFERRIPLPCEVATDKAKATFKKGVLTVTLPKTEKARSAKKITISSAS